MALAHLLIEYGRRIVPKSQITLLHVDHGWRGAKSKADAAFVERFAKKAGVPLKIEVLKTPQDPRSSYLGRSWEEVAREARKEFFARVSRESGGVVLTAHQGDDLAETLLWRLFTGAAMTHGGGIRFRSGQEMRPFLLQRKTTLIKYLKEEKQRFRVDETNFENRFLRSRIRKQIIPAVERLFPRALNHLIELGLKAQDAEKSVASISARSSTQAFQDLFAAAGLRGRRNHWEALAAGQSKMDLPGGWTLIQDSKDRWVLERNRERNS